ncbi:hypothetical protein QBC32DRAFT_216885, partial [Pseudoneurospora amorphoporcata]
PRSASHAHPGRICWMCGTTIRMPMSFATPRRSYRQLLCSFHWESEQFEIDYHGIVEKGDGRCRQDENMHVTRQCAIGRAKTPAPRNVGSALDHYKVTDYEHRYAHCEFYAR